MKTILASAYAINPYKGSEDGMGWNFVCQIARYNKVLAVTRENNQAAIEKYMSENPNELYKNIHFLYYDTPYWMRFWKKGGRGAMLYYYLWQRTVVAFVKKQKLQFDIVHNLNFHNDWTPSFLWKLNRPMVWGPIGHHPQIPFQYLEGYKASYKWKEIATWAIKKLFWNFSFSLKNTVKHANHIFCMNTGVAKVLDLSSKEYTLMPSVATEDFFDSSKVSRAGFHVISVGRFVPLKGFDLTIKSFAGFIHSLPEEQKTSCKLTLVGSGPEKGLYEIWIKEFGIEKNVEIIEWIERKELMKLYEKSSLYLFPSHEGAGMVVAEALSFSLPVLCLQNEGPGEFIDASCGIAVPIDSNKKTIENLSNALSKLHSDSNLLTKMSLNARNRYEQKFTWDSRGETLREVYAKIG